MLIDQTNRKLIQLIGQWTNCLHGLINLSDLSTEQGRPIGFCRK